MPPEPHAPARTMLRARLREVVSDMQVGDRLPGERDLAERWGVARMTLRGAIDALVTEGLLERRHGSGTYVTPRPLVRVLGLTSFSQDMRERGLVPGSRLMAFSTRPADAALAAQLRIPVDEPVFNFTRIRLGSGEPMAVETTWIPVGYVPGLAERDLSGSLYEVLARRYRIEMGAAKVCHGTGCGGTVLISRWRLRWKMAFGCRGIWQRPQRWNAPNGSARSNPCAPRSRQRRSSGRSGPR